MLRMFLFMYFGINVILEEQEWIMEIPNRYCKTGKLAENTQTQLECQDLCTEHPYCVGISYGHMGGKPDCFICQTGDILSSANNSYAFYRRPGKVSTNRKSLVYNQPNDFIFTCYYYHYYYYY